MRNKGGKEIMYYFKIFARYFLAVLQFILVKALSFIFEIDLLIEKPLPK